MVYDEGQPDVVATKELQRKMAAMGEHHRGTRQYKYNKASLALLQ